MSDAPLIQLEWERAHALIAEAKRVAVVTHLSPDGDAIGSMLGMTQVLQSLGKQVTPMVDGGLPARFAFVPASDQIVDSADGVDVDLVVSTDASDLARLGTIGHTLRTTRKLPLVQLDHHQTNLMFGDANLVDARTAAAAEGVLDMIDHFGWRLTPSIAIALLTGIVTDTICFRTSNTTPAVLGKAQRLMNQGADLVGIVQRTLATVPTALMRLQGRVLNRLQLEDGVIWVTISADDYTSVGLQPEEYNGLSGYLVQSEDAHISAVIKESEDGEVKVSMRAIPGFNVADVALSFGGGGHVAAAGFSTTAKTVDEVVAELIPRLKLAVQNGQRVYG